MNEIIFFYKICIFHCLKFLYGIRVHSLIFLKKTIGRISCVAMEDHSKDAIDVDSKISTPTNYSDDTNTSKRLSSVLLNEFNYLSQSKVVTIALGGRSKLGFIKGLTISPEVNDPEYKAWLSKVQLIMSWILKSMERNLAEIFSFLESSSDLQDAIHDMYGNQNNSTRIFQIHCEVAHLHQEGKPFVQLLGSFTSLWNELEMYCPHTTIAAILQKRIEEDIIFQLLASLSLDFEDL